MQCAYEYYFGNIVAKISKNIEYYNNCVYCILSILSAKIVTKFYFPVDYCLT